LFSVILLNLYLLTLFYESLRKICPGKVSYYTIFSLLQQFTLGNSKNCARPCASCSVKLKNVIEITCEF